MKIVVALGGNALLTRGEPLVAERLKLNAMRAAHALYKLVASGHELIITHGNGPQIGLIAEQAAAIRPPDSFPLDVLGAQSDGMIGYMLEQELDNAFKGNIRVVTLLTSVEVNPDDPAFQKPSKPIGPVYTKEEASKLEEQYDWVTARDGDGFRRVVPSPAPAKIQDLDVIKLLVNNDVVVICVGGGGVPVIRHYDGSVTGVEAVIDKDHSSALLASSLEADMLLMLTDVDGVYTDYQTTRADRIDSVSAKEIKQYDFPDGSMGPKVEAACEFVTNMGGIAGIGELGDALEIVERKAGTLIVAE